MSGIRSLTRRPGQVGFATKASAPIRVDDTTGLVLVNGAGSGSTETTLVDLATAQSLTNKTLGAGTVLTGAAYSEAVTASGGATRVLLAAGSGSVNLFDAASGIGYTLPVPVVGLNFTFYTTVLQTSGANEVVTDAGTTFLVGSIVMFSGENVTPSATLGPKQFAANGTSHVEFTMDGTTQGGGIGSWVTFVCISATLWYVTGVINSPSGTIASPFTT